MTTLRSVISDCPPGCTVKVEHSNMYAPTLLVPSGEVLASVRVRNGRAEVRVPTAVTHGLLFLVADAAGHAAGEGEVGVALRYAGFAVGRTVTNRESDRARLGADCWAGTTRADGHLQAAGRGLFQRRERPRATACGCGPARV